MSKELVISANRHETKVAILEDDQLVEIYFQRANEYSLAGSIHKGRVTRVLPGMQSAFVDLGLERDTFLYVSDFFEENGEDFDSLVPGERGRDERPREERPAREDVAPREERPQRDDRAPREDRGRRDDRGGRFDRQPRPDRGPIEAVMERPVMDAVVEVASPLEGLDAAQPPASRGPETADDRNRRSRRRRNRGRGFPDSKYASEVGDPSRATDTDVVEASEETISVEPEIEVEFPVVLPGESLAKYRHSEPPAVQPSSTQQILSEATGRYRGRPSRHEQYALRQSGGETGAIPGETIAKYQQPHVEPAVEAVVHPAPEADHVVEHEVVLEASHLPTESIAKYRNIPAVVPVVEVAHVPPVHEPVPSPDPDPAPAPMPEPESPVAELAASHFEPSHFEVSHLDVSHGGAAPAREAEAAEAVQDIVEEKREGGSYAPEDIADALNPGVELIETDDLESMSIVTDDDMPAPENDLDSEGEEGDESPMAVEGAEPVGEGAQTANVREQGGRYNQRNPRRMRRNKRGGQGRNQGALQGPHPQAVVQGAVEPVAEPVAAFVPRTEARPEVRERRPDRERPPLPSIAELLKEGQEIIVQIAKEPLGQKGARITSHIAMPGRYVVYMPTLEHVGVSRKIASDEERLRLKKILQAHRVGVPGGYIVRTAGEGQSEEEIAADMAFLANLWADIRQKADRKPAPLLLHHDLDVVQRILRDQVSADFKSIWVDNEEFYESILSFVQRFQPALVTKVKLYTRSAPIFDAFSITPELEKALRPKVWLKSGGYIVINQTEALVAIDVNTGKYVGKSNRLEDTIVKTNTEAVKEIVRQIRLRDLGGIIVVDFIDMDERKNRQKVMQALEEAMRADKAPYKILQFNDFGLVAITRKRVKQSLERALCSPCPYCEGAGYVKSVATTVSEILQEAQKIAKAVDGKDVLLRVHPEVAKYLKSNDNKYLEEMEEVLRRPVLVKGDPTLHQDKFDLA